MCGPSCALITASEFKTTARGGTRCKARSLWGLGVLAVFGLRACDRHWHLWVYWSNTFFWMPFENRIRLKSTTSCKVLCKAVSPRCCDMRQAYHNIWKQKSHRHIHTHSLVSLPSWEAVISRGMHYVGAPRHNAFPYPFTLTWTPKLCLDPQKVLKICGVQHFGSHKADGPHKYSGILVFGPHEYDKQDTHTKTHALYIHAGQQVPTSSPHLVSKETKTNRLFLKAAGRHDNWQRPKIPNCLFLQAATCQRSEVTNTSVLFLFLLF